MQATRTPKFLGKTTPRLGLATLAVLGLAAATPAAAQGPKSKFYLTAGDDNKNIIIQGGTATVTPQAAGSEYVIAVGRDVRTLNYYAPNADGAQYDLNFKDTGTRYSTPAAFVDAYDGTTDGGHNYAVNFDTGVVYQAGRDWQTPTVLFTLHPGELGITFDQTNNSLWVSDFGSTTVTDYSLAGIALSAFSTPFSQITSLGLDGADNTLWMGSQGTEGTFYQYSKAGTPLQQVTYSNLARLNTLGGEFNFVPSTSPASTPEPSTVAPFACAALGLLGLAWHARRRA